MLLNSGIQMQKISNKLVFRKIYYCFGLDCSKYQEEIIKFMKLIQL